MHAHDTSGSRFRHRGRASHDSVIFHLWFHVLLRMQSWRSISDDVVDLNLLRGKEASGSHLLVCHGFEGKTSKSKVHAEFGD